MPTPYHAKYFSHEISRHHQTNGVQKITHSLFDACVDLNPHQIEASLFAIKSPLSKGAILADEVGLGKTIEAGIILCQYWAERKRRLLIICPASIRKQWSIELEEKFHLQSIILDSYTVNQDQVNPFDSDLIIITSIHFASKHCSKLRHIPWDIVVIDEAHKLRNVYRTRNKMAQNIKWALEDRFKLLLTATPVQNSLLELFGLACIIDEHIFGDVDAFKTQFVNNQNDLDLSKRLNTFCKRTLRKHVTEYVKYTNRRSITVSYAPTDHEHVLYQQISEYLQRDDIYAIPKGTSHLITLVIRKILASSSYAIASTLEKLRKRLRAYCAGLKKSNSISWSQLVNDEDWTDYIQSNNIDLDSFDQMEMDPDKINNEIDTLTYLINRARNIKTDTKSLSLLKALDIGFSELDKMNAPHKAIIFTESRKTQEYLESFLANNGYKDQIVLFNGSNNGQIASKIYNNWVKENQHTGQVSGSKAIDIRKALVEYFKNDAKIMIATEAAAEGINLQFCSLVINYDLPWNPQRIEQRIGRCHRYGQKRDVVVINFLNSRNEADCRVYELLNDKLSLFTGVFGSSDDVLGKLESGMDFEKRIHNIYQACRSETEIQKAFSDLQKEMDTCIQSRLKETKTILLEHFDQDVHSRLKIQLDDTKYQLDKMSQYFWTLCKFTLADIAQFHDYTLQLDLFKSPMKNIQPGKYYLTSKDRKNISNKYLLRLSHPLGEYIISAGKIQETPPAHLFFDISNHDKKISVIESLKTKSGWLALYQFIIYAFEKEEYLIFVGFTNDGHKIDNETCENLFLCQGAASPIHSVPDSVNDELKSQLEIRTNKIKNLSIRTNNSYFNDECDKLDTWADDMIIPLEEELKRIKLQIKQKSRQIKLETNEIEQHKLLVELKHLQARKKNQRQKLFKIEDDIMNQRECFIQKIADKMEQKTETKHLFSVKWTVV